MGSHPACRCVQIPVLENAPLRETGEQAFARLPEAQQREVLGDAKFAAYRNGEISLRSLVGYRNDRRWGETRWERGLADAQRGKMDARWGELPTAEQQPKPAQPTGPAGKPIAPALKLPKRGDLTRIGRNVLGLIDRVHGDGELPSIPLVRERKKNYFGSYSYQKASPHNAVQISIRTSGFADHPELTLAHEIGHFLDHWGAGKGMHASVAADEFEEFRRVAGRSKAVQEIERLIAARKVSVTLGGGGTIDYPIDRRYLRYLATTKEVWARAYAQYITLRTGDPTMRSQLNQLRQRLGQVYYPSQWDDDDFEPIAEAIDRLMLRLGWRK